MIQIDDPEEELEQVPNYGNVRIFRNALRYTDTPQEDLLEIAMNWSVPNEGKVWHCFVRLHSITNFARYHVLGELKMYEYSHRYWLTTSTPCSFPIALMRKYRWPQYRWL